MRPERPYARRSRLSDLTHALMTAAALLTVLYLTAFGGSTSRDTKGPEKQPAATQADR